jgi:hypothetical protein
MNYKVESIYFYIRFSLASHSLLTRYAAPPRSRFRCFARSASLVLIGAE